MIAALSARAHFTRTGHSDLILLAKMKPAGSAPVVHSRHALGTALVGPASHLCACPLPKREKESCKFPETTISETKHNP